MGVGILTSPRLSAAVLEFTPVDERVTSLYLMAGGKTLTVVSAYAPNGSVEYAAFLEVLAGALQWAPVGDSVVLLGTSTRDWEERPP